MMPFGDQSLDAPLKPNKGHEGGACNVRSCQAEPASHYNHGSYSWYCADCAVWIGEDVVNKRDWELRWRPKCGHAMFETREEMDSRIAAALAQDEATLARGELPAYEGFYGYDRPRAGQAPRQQGKTAALETHWPDMTDAQTLGVKAHGAIITDYDGPPEEGEGRRWSPMATGDRMTRQQRRANQRAEMKRLRKRS